MENKKEIELFLRDICTASEIKAMAERWAIAKLLQENMSYRDIAEVTNSSTTTVARVANWLQNGNGGYDLALKKTNHHNPSKNSEKS